MPGGRVPPQLLITSRCGGWFEQKEKDTRTVWPPQPAGMNRRLRAGKGTRVPLTVLLSFLRHCSRPNSPWRAEMKTCRLSPPPPSLVCRSLVVSESLQFTEFHLSRALPLHPIPSRSAFYCSPLLRAGSPSLRFLPSLNVVSQKRPDSPILVQILDLSFCSSVLAVSKVLNLL